MEFIFKENNLWIELKPKGCPPTPRVSTSALIYDEVIYFFGGYDGETWKNDIFVYIVKSINPINLKNLLINIYYLFLPHLHYEPYFRKIQLL